MRAAKLPKPKPQDSPAHLPGNPATKPRRPIGRAPQAPSDPVEARRPIKTPADLAAAIRSTADANIDAATSPALKAAPTIPLPTHSLALLLRRLAVHRSVAAARRLLDELHPPASGGAPRGALLALADAVCRGGDPREISQLLPVLADRGVQADAHLYNSLMKAHVTASDPAGALAALARMKADGVDPNLVTYNTEHRLLLPLSSPLSTPEPSAIVSSSVVAGARAAGVAAGPSCHRAETPPFSTGEDPLSTLSSVCPRLSALLRLRVAGSASFSAMVFMCTPVEWSRAEASW
jgi:pentatricopeptide repeat protein